MSPLQIKSLIVDVPDFPKPGIVFKDITPVLSNPTAFKSVIEQLAERAAGLNCDERRQPIFCCPYSGQFNNGSRKYFLLKPSTATAANRELLFLPNH
jgi:adenine phosphoribosyltransferase